jgi:hypothetical protein
VPRQSRSDLQSDLQQLAPSTDSELGLQALPRKCFAIPCQPPPRRQGLHGTCGLPSLGAAHLAPSDPSALRQIVALRQLWRTRVRHQQLALHGRRRGRRTFVLGRTHTHKGMRTALRGETVACQQFTYMLACACLCSVLCVRYFHYRSKWTTCAPGPPPIPSVAVACAPLAATIPTRRAVVPAPRS